MKKIILILGFIFAYSVAFGQQASKDIKSIMSSEGKVLYGNEPNSIVVVDYPENIQRVAEYLETLDVPPQQVLIEARVVEVKLQKEHSLGVNWKAFMDRGYMPIGRFKAGAAIAASDLGIMPQNLEQSISYKPTFYPPAQTSSGQESPFTFAIFDDNISIVLKTLAANMDTDILSAPRITTVNNREAEIKVITRLPWAEPQVTVSDTGTVTVTWTINYEEVGITLKATPTITEDGNITMVLAPEVSEKVSDYNLTVTQGTTSVPYTVPIIDKRTASTKVVVGSGQTLIIGGLIKDKTTKGSSKIPLLGDIPGLGYLFKSVRNITDKTELLIFVSPTVITPKEFVRMAKEKKYGLNKVFADQEEKEKKESAANETAAKTQRDKLSAQLQSLEQKQKALVETRKKLETDIAKEEEGFREIAESRGATVRK